MREHPGAEVVLLDVCTIIDLSSWNGGIEGG